MALLIEKASSLWAKFYSSPVPVPPHQTTPLPLSILWHRLPEELKDMVWEHVFTLDHRIYVSTMHQTSLEQALALLGTCKAVHKRHVRTFWSQNVFVFGTFTDRLIRSRFYPLLRRGPPAECYNYIRTLEVDSISLIGLIGQKLHELPALELVYVDNYTVTDPCGTVPRTGSGMLTVFEAAKQHPKLEFAVATGTCERRAKEKTVYTIVTGGEDGKPVVREVPRFKDNRGLPWWVRDRHATAHWTKRPWIDSDYECGCESDPEPESDSESDSEC